MFTCDGDVIAVLCEIAFRAGVLTDKGIIDIQTPNCTIDEMCAVYMDIYNEWLYGLDKGIFKDKEEEGYAYVYAERVLIERYGKNKKRVQND